MAAGSTPGGGVRLGVRTKILSAVLVAALVGLVVGLVGVVRLASVADNAEAIYDRGVVPIQHLTSVRRGILQVRLDTTNQALSLDEAGTAKYEGALDEDDAKLAEAMDAYAAVSTDPAAFETLRADWARYVELRDTKMLPLGRADDFDAWQKVRDEQAAPVIQAMGATLEKLMEAERAGAAAQRDAAAASYASGRLTILAVLVVGLVASVALGGFVAGRITTPLRRVADGLEAMAHGDLTVEVSVTTKDEVGAMATALTQAQHGMSEALAQVLDGASSLAGAAEELDTMTMTIAAAAQQASDQATSVAAGAEQVSRNVSTVAAAGEQMHASIQEIARNTTAASVVANEAVEITETTSRTVAQLGDSGREIGEVVRVITSIADQTNLLALNATIEAARAGEAGKGFAVVANEVKELAQQTGSATGDIAQRVEKIQSDTSAAIEAIAKIADVVSKIDGYQTTVAGAVEEQSATTNELTHNVGEAAVGSSTIAETISGVADATNRTSETVGQVRQASTEVSRMSQELQTLVARFRVR